MIDRNEMAQGTNAARDKLRKAIKVVSAKRNKRQQRLREQEEELALNYPRPHYCEVHRVANVSQA